MTIAFTVEELNNLETLIRDDERKSMGHLVDTLYTSDPTALETAKTIVSKYLAHNPRRHWNELISIFKYELRSR